jgi:hypothetical protein
VLFSISMGTLIALPFIGDFQATRASVEQFEPQDKSAEVTKEKKKKVLSQCLFVCPCVSFSDK